MPVLVRQGDDTFTDVYGSKFYIGPDGTFPIHHRISTKPIVTYNNEQWGIEKIVYYAVKGKRLWVFHPTDRTLVRIQTPVNLGEVASTLDCPRYIS